MPSVLPQTALGMEWAWVAPALGVLAFILISFFGNYLPGKGFWIAVAAIGLGFILFWFVLADLLSRGAATYNITWFEAGGTRLKLGMIVDNLSVLMLGVVTSVALAVQVYSIGYMKGDPRFGWYYAAHSLFAAAMLVLVLADNFLLLYVGWELVGLCSYLLIGFWYERRSAAEAAKKAFITTRIGDVGLLIGILILFKATGTFDMTTIFDKAVSGQIEGATLTAAAILIFAGAMGKSAQFPLHVWLPDAMEGPTPVSALIHAATMVAAGVYLVARTFPLFVASPVALTVVTVIGLITVLMASTMALVMTDFKRVLAYSTIAQLGFMLLGLASLGYTAGMFHLTSHAFFKALLFLTAGSVIHATEKQDINQMGGLARRMPWTAAVFIIAALAMSGLPPFSGYFSKDEILIAVWENQNPLVYILVAFSAFLSALYMARLLFLVFFGELKEENHHVHESPWTMLVPMIALAVPSLFMGFALFDWVGPLFGLPSQYQGFGSFLYLHEPEAFHFSTGIGISSALISVAALVLGWLIYSRKSISSAAIQGRFAPIHRLLVNKYYMDDLYQAMIDRVALAFSRFVAVFDRVVINDIGVNGTGAAARFAGFVLKFHQTGLVYNYLLVMLTGVLVIILVTALMR